MSPLQIEPDIAVSVKRCMRAWSDNGYRLGGWHEHGPAGFKFGLSHDVPPRLGSVIVSQAEMDDGIEWIHASIAWTQQMPTYDELTTLHRSVFGLRRYAYQAFVPADQHVNIHRYALHLWGRTDGASALPNFGEMGTI